MFINLFSWLTVFLLAVFGRAQSCPECDIVDLGYAKYLGNRTYPNSVAYLGIPYAQPPIEDLRFRAPVPLNVSGNATEVINATIYPQNCFQQDVVAGSEDCLKLNVYAPAGSKEGDELPTLFYIHGGGYRFGDPNTWPFDHWIEQSPNIVIVSVYYRLGPFGFLSTPEFVNSSLGDFNAGFLDQIEALNWTIGHISAFGGAANNITIMGQSAGAHSVQLHLVARDQPPRFQAAIAQSIPRRYTPYPNQTTSVFQTLSQYSGCSQSDIESQLLCLRTIDARQLASAGDATTASTVVGFKPVIDGVLFTKSPTKAILDGDFLNVPLIIGSTSNETLTGGADPASELQSFFLNYTDLNVAELAAAYDYVPFASESLKSQTIVGDAELRCARTILGQRFTKSWTYRFNQPNPLDHSDLVTHSADNYFMFNGSDGAIQGVTTFYPLNTIEQSLSEEVIAYYVSFIRSQNPNTFKLERSLLWDPYTAESRSRMVFNEPLSDPTNETGSALEIEAEWEALACQMNAKQVIVQQN